MDVDPEFEFECPKWVDFDFEEGEEFEECLDDSWFGRDHPLHEPKDKDENEQPKPLIDVKEHENTTTTATKVVSKNKNSKKSIGVKRSVTMQRRKGGRMLPDVNKISSQNQENSSGTVSKCEFNEKRDFTPPSTYTSPLRSDKSNTPLSALHSPLRGKLGTSPSSVNSPKRKLLAKATSNAANADEQRKRRRLPTIPNESQDVSTLLPLRAKSSSDDSKQPHSFTRTPDHSPYRIEPKQQIFNNQQHKQHQNKTGIEDEKSLEEMLKLHNQKVMASKCKYDSNGRRIKPENSSNIASSSTNNSKDTCLRDKVIRNTSVNNYVVVETTGMASKKLSQRDDSKKQTLKEMPAISKASKNISNKDNDLNSIEEDQEVEMSVEDLLKLHNKKVTASKCKYDSNGRRIQPGNPAFCPAPSKSEPTTSKTTLSRSKSQSLVQKKTTDKPNDTKPKPNPKHHRRSCIAAPSTLPTETSTLTNNSTDSSGKAVRKNKRRSCIEGSATSTVTGGLAQKSHKQKRRSCFAAAQEMAGQAGSEVDDELKGLIARHNQRLAMLK